MFKWLDNFLIKFSKKILNRYAPTGEFIAYINKDEEKILKQLGGYGKPINETGIKSFISIKSVVKSAVSFVTKKVHWSNGFIKNSPPSFCKYKCL